MKRELIHKALKSISLDIRVMESFSRKGDFDMYGYTLAAANNKVELLLDMGLISQDKYFLLKKIIAKMPKKGVRA